jgi:hypothetical protein
MIRRKGSVGPTARVGLAVSLGIGILCASAAFGVVPAGASAHATVTVPRDFPTIQSAVEAASPGDTIVLAAGTFNEQVVITKNLTLRGAGAGSTTIKAPRTLVAGPFGDRREIVTIMSGAKVSMSNLSVAGPGTEPCDSSTSLSDGVLVVQDATLDMHSAAVTDIRGPSSGLNCPLVGAILIGLPDALPGGPSTGHGTITDVFVSGFATFGISVSGPNSTTGPTSTATFAHNRVTGFGLAGHTATVGMSVFHATGTMVDNTITDNLCDVPGCGPDPISQLQATGIGATFAGPGTVIAHNRVSGNDVGIYLAFSPNCCSTNHNMLTDNRYIGDVIQDGDNTISHDVISGGQVGVGVVATSVNTTGALRNVSTTSTSVAPTQNFSCCGFTAMVSRLK